jgi:beta-N-acetylhexosaminidase
VSGELERLAAACVLPSFRGHAAPAWVLRGLEAGLGGVCLFASNIGDPEQVAALTAALSRAREGAVIALDEEGGDVTRLEWRTGSSYPGNLALGAVDDPELTRAVAAAIARDLRAVGVTLNLAPVADVNTNPQNPVIGVRSFGSDAALVARHVAAFVEGTQDAGVLACAKHFPGHGDTQVDSHHDLPTVDCDPDELDQALEPFRAAIGAGVAAVMTGHIVVPLLEDAPVTVCAPAITGLLRRELGFEGLVITDALDMGAVARGRPLAVTGVAALAAGADLLCLGPAYGKDEVDVLCAAIVTAVREDRLAEERVAEAAGRVERASPPAAATRANGQPGRDAATRALRIAGDVRLAGAPLVVELVPEPLMAAGEARHSFGSALRERRDDTRVVQMHGAGAVPETNGRTLVIVVRDPGRHTWQREVAEQLVAAHPDAVVVDVGVPGWVPPARGTVRTYGGGRANLEAAAAALARL